jgi:hypothetical protein
MLDLMVAKKNKQLQQVAKIIYLFDKIKSKKTDVINALADTPDGVLQPALWEIDPATRMPMGSQRPLTQVLVHECHK